MDCKNALAANGGDLDKAFDWLRKKGLATASKKASRAAADGLVAVVADESAATCVEVRPSIALTAARPAEGLNAPPTARAPRCDS